MADQNKDLPKVQELINRLREEGVKAAQAQADQMLKDAREKAERIVAEANAKTEERRKQTEEAIMKEKKDADEALKIAVRNAEKDLENRLQHEFEIHVKRLIAKEMRDEEFLRQLLTAIVTVTADRIPTEPPLQILAPETVLQQDNAIKFTQEGKERLVNFVRCGTTAILRKGVELLPASDQRGGIQVKIVDENVTFDFSPNALSGLILKHLLPRYQAIVEGAE